ncbi:MAG: zeta toxin family protein [Oscillospiraceae bacterium]
MEKLIAVMGSPGSGKSTVSLAIASYFSSKKENTIILSADKTVPMMPVYEPTNTTIDTKYSLGRLLADGDITEETVLDKICFHNNSDNLGLMALTNEDNMTTYPHYFNREKINSLLGVLYRVADYVIVDCTSDFVNDSLTLTALEKADVIIRLLTADSKGIVYWSSQKGLLQDDKFIVGKTYINAISNYKQCCPVEETKHAIGEVLGEIKYFFPYSYDIEDKMISGKLIKGLSRREGIQFENNIKKLAEMEVI